jgi:hypothetical protein
MRRGGINCKLLEVARGNGTFHARKGLHTRLDGLVDATRRCPDEWVGRGRCPTLEQTQKVKLGIRRYKQSAICEYFAEVGEQL